MHLTFTINQVSLMKSIIEREVTFKNSSDIVTQKPSSRAFIKETRYAQQSNQLDKPSTYGESPLIEGVHA